MATQPSRAGSLLQFIAIFVLVYMGTQYVMGQFFPEAEQEERTGVLMEPVDSTVKGQHHPVLRVTNYSDQQIELEDRCPLPPVLVWRIADDGSREELRSATNAVPCTPVTVLAAGETTTIDLAPWKFSLFNEYATYEVALPDTDIEAQFSVYEPGVMTKLFRTFITKPLLNALVLIAAVMPDYNLGIAILILTLIVKLMLFVPTQHAMEGQKKMQVVQPKMDALKKKHKDNPQKLQAETVKLWKEHNVNPMQSCLPMLIQFPILIGLFFTIRDGSVLGLSEHLLYGFNQHLPWTFGTQFLGLNLLEPSVYVMPPLLMIMQFLQMKLSFAINEKKKHGKQGKQGKDGMSQQEVQQKVMMYGLPLMIGFFALQFPAAVSLYWATSTVFAVGQQVYVNRKDL